MSTLLWPKLLSLFFSLSCTNINNKEIFLFDPFFAHMSKGKRIQKLGIDVSDRDKVRNLQQLLYVKNKY